MANNHSRPVWWPFPRPIFTFLVIDSSGVPIIEYPPPESASNGSKTVLVSGLLTAVNNLAHEISGDDVNNMTFGSYLVTISKGPNNTLCVLLCDTEFLDNMSKASSMHVELKSLLFTRISDVKSLYTIKEGSKEVLKEIFEPYYRLKVKDLLKRLKADT